MNIKTINYTVKATNNVYKNGINNKLTVQRAAIDARKNEFFVNRMFVTQGLISFTAIISHTVC